MPEYQYLGSRGANSEDTGTTTTKTVGNSVVFGVTHGAFVDFTASPPMEPDLAELIQRELGIQNNKPQTQTTNAQVGYNPLGGHRTPPYLQRGRIPGVSHLAGKR